MTCLAVGLFLTFRANMRLNTSLTAGLMSSMVQEQNLARKVLSCSSVGNFATAMPLSVSMSADP